MEILFLNKGISNFFRPPKLGAKVPPMCLKIGRVRDTVLSAVIWAPGYLSVGRFCASVL